MKIYCVKPKREQVKKSVDLPSVVNPKKLVFIAGEITRNVAVLAKGVLV